MDFKSSVRVFRRDWTMCKNTFNFKGVLNVIKRAYVVT